jgi:putative serine protease PepD
MTPEERPRWRPRTLAVLAAAILAAAGLGAAVTVLASGSDGRPAATEAVTASRPAALVTSSALTIGEIYERSAAGVVEIAVAGSSSSGFPPFDGQSEGTGSGFVLDDEGHIVTNEHVVEGAGTITVSFPNGKEVPATLVGEDASSDIAVVDVDLPADELDPLTLGSSSEVGIGDPVVAIGSPFGFEGSVTSGIVSALARTIDAPNGYAITGAIQTDAAINQGNSGGPLLGSSGEVIGVNAQIASQSGGNDGVGFAIPIDTARRVAAQLIAGESVEHAYLGVSLVDSAQPEGAGISSVLDATPAAEAGLLAGDVITEFDGTPVASAGDLSAAVAAAKPGGQVTLTIIRNGSQRTVEVRLGVRPS